MIRQTVRWWRLPIWVLAIFTGAKSFVDNPVLGSKRLNRWGLHVWRLKASHWLAWFRRRRLAVQVPPDLKRQFDRDGFIVVPGFLPQQIFDRIRAAILEAEFECREHQQGDTITRRVPVGPHLLGKIPELDRILGSASWRGIMSYVSSTRREPLYYIQTIVGGCVEAPPDPQVELHSDTFHPSMKAWLFLTDVGPDDRPLTYVAGSHRLSPERLAWEQRKSVDVAVDGDRLSQRGSFRIRPEELASLKLPEPTHFAVPANTLVAADTSGFHARASSDRPTLRVELWAYSRRTPFLPWPGFYFPSWRSISRRRVEWLGPLVDRLSRRGLMIQHWRPAGKKRPLDAN